MSKGINFLLVTDSSHPEIFAIADELSSQGIRFTLLSSFLFTKNEWRFIRRLPFYPSVLRSIFGRRLVDTSSGKSSLVRTVPLTDLLSKILNRIPNQFRGAWWVYVIRYIDHRLKVTICAKSEKLLKRTVFSHIVYLSSFEIDTIDLDLIPIEIAYHGEFNQEIYWKNIAAEQYPQWKDTWRIYSKGNTELQNPVLGIQSPKMTVYASSFNATYRSNSSKSLYVPLGGIKTGEMQPELKSDELRLIHVGQLGLRKGIPIILEVASKVDAKFILCGNGTAEVIGRIENAKIPNLELLLSPSDSIIRRELAAAQAFILPSYYEGFGIAILEAMSFGCIPIVSMNTCGPDILKGSELERFLIPAGKVSVLENTIKHLLEMDHSEKLHLGKIAADLSKKYTFATYGEQVIKKVLT